MRRPRTTSVLVVVAAGILLVIAATQPWYGVALAAGGDPLEVDGAAALPVLAPLGLAAIALGLALSVVGQVVRFVLGVAAAAIGVGVAVLAVRTALTPLDAVSGAVTTATGIEGSGVGDLVTAIAPTAWPWAAVAASVVLAAGGVLVLATARRWTRAGRRFDAGETVVARPRDTVDSWDDLSHGADPTA